jgi:O-antigen ligase
MECRLEKTAFIVYLIIIVLCPLLFGAVHTYAYTIMILGILFANLLLLKNNIQRDPKSGRYLFDPYPLDLSIIFFILFCLLVIQVIPLPEAILKLLSPEAFVVGQKSIPASHIPDSGTGNIYFSISPYYYPIRLSMNRFCAYGLLFIGLVRVLNSKKRIEQIIFVILILACFEAFYGLIQTYSGSNHIWWFKKMGSRMSVTGTYINPNHFAGFMELCLLIVIAYAVALSNRKKKSDKIRAQKRRLRVRFVRFLSKEQRINKQLLILFAGVVIGTVLIFSASRGGLIAASGALFLLGVFFLFRKNFRKNGMIIFSLFFVILVYALHLGAEYSLNRFAQMENSYEVRARLAQKTMDMSENYPWTGVGVGNFQYAYPTYQAAEDQNVFVRHAHNDWAQFLAEAGIIGMGFLLMGMAYFIYVIIKTWKKRHDPFPVSLGLLPLAAMTTMAIHSYSDFNLHIPANALFFMAAMAIGYSALRLRQNHRKGTISEHNRLIPFRFKGAMVVCIFLGLIIWNGVWVVRHFIAELYCNTVHNSTLNREILPPLEDINKAIEWDPYNAAYWWKQVVEQARIRESEWGLLDEKMRQDKQQEIIESLEKAIFLNPYNAQYHLKLAMEYIRVQPGQGDLKDRVASGDTSAERAAYFAGEMAPYLHVSIGNYWVIRSKMTTSYAKWEMLWAKARWHYQKAQQLKGNRFVKNRIRKFVWMYYPDQGIIHDVIRQN